MDRGPKALLGLLAVWLVLAPATISPLGPNPPSPILRVGTVLGLLAAAGLVARLPWVPMLGLLGLPVLVSLANWPGAAVAERDYKVLLAFVAVIAASAAVRRTETMPAVVRVLLYLSVPLMVLAAYQSVVGSWPYFDQHAVDAHFLSAGYPHRAAATFGQPILYGMFAGFMLIVALRLRPRGWLLLAAVNTVGLVLAGARGSWLALAVVGVVVAARSLASDRATWSVSPSVVVAGCGIVVVAAGLGVVVPTTYSHVAAAVQSRFTGEARSVSAQSRIDRVGIATDQLDGGGPAQWLVGFGPQSAAVFFGQTAIHDRGTAVFDNTYLTILFEYGLLGLLAVAFALWLALRRGDPTGRLLVLYLAVDFFTFDIMNWPSTLGLLAVAVMLRSSPLGTAASGQVEVEPEPVHVASEAGARSLIAAT